MSSSSGSTEHADYKYKIINNRFIVISEIGSGSYGCVWLTYDIVVKKYFAIKIHPCEYIKHGKRETLVNEIVKNKCPYFVEQMTTFDCVIDDDECYCCVMELMSYSMYEICQKYKPYKKGLPYNFVVKVIYQTLVCLNNMHKKRIIHADVKPENILLEGIRDEERCIIDKIGVINTKKATATKILEFIKNALGDNNESDEDSDDDNDDNHDNNDTNDNNDEITSDTYSDATISISTDEGSDSDDDDTVSTHEPKIENSCIKLTDMGLCVFPDQHIRRKHIQTCYYRSPEILLDVGYDEKSDIWATGCTMYELLINKIMFDADRWINDYTNKHHLYLIIEKLGFPPLNMIEASPKKDLFFTCDMKKIRGYNEIAFSPLHNEIHLISRYKNITEEDERDLVDVMHKMLQYNASDRPSAEELLNHNIFRSCKTH